MKRRRRHTHKKELTTADYIYSSAKNNCYALFFITGKYIIPGGTSKYRINTWRGNTDRPNWYKNKYIYIHLLSTGYHRTSQCTQVPVLVKLFVFLASQQPGALLLFLDSTAYTIHQTHLKLTWLVSQCLPLTQQDPAVFELKNDGERVQWNLKWNG